MCVPQTTLRSFFGQQEIGVRNVRTAAILFMKQHENEEGRHFFNIDSSTLYHFANSNCSLKLRQLTLAMLMLPKDTDHYKSALLAVYKHLYFDETEGMFPRLFSAIGADACKFFKFRFFFESSSEL